MIVAERHERKDGHRDTGDGAPSCSDLMVDSWRKAVLDRVLVALWAATTLSLLVVLREVFVEGHWRLLPALALAWLVLTPVTWIRAFSVRVRAAGLLSAFAIACLGSMTQAGYLVPNPFVALSASVVLFALFAGARAAWWALAGLLSACAGVAALYLSQPLAVNPLLLDLQSTANWLRVLLVFAGITAAAIGSVAYLTSRLEDALRQSQSLLDALASENAERIAVSQQHQELERQFRQAQKLEALGTLAGGIAHDFNNLLVVIGSHAELLQARTPADRSEASLGAIREATQRAAALTRQLLVFSRRQVAERECIDLNQAVEHSLTMLARLLREDITVEFVPADVPLYILSLQVEIDQLLINLSVNARDAMPRGGRLHIETRLVPRQGADDPLVCLVVRDTGQGIPESNRDRIFDPFFSTKPEDKGTGLGLSVVHGIVTQVGGHIEVDSVPGTGTEFRLFLPAGAPGGETRPFAGAPEGELRGDELVVMADDDDQVRAVMAEMLQDAGYRVMSCRDGREAIDLVRAQAQEVALVISDAVMPKMGGGALHETLLANHPDVPCLICSGYARAALPPDLLDHPHRDFLAKPFTRTALLQRVAKLLVRRRRARRVASSLCELAPMRDAKKITP